MKGKFEKVAEGAYFAVDYSATQSTVSQYDPRISNQTIVTDWNCQTITEDCDDE